MTLVPEHSAAGSDAAALGLEALRARLAEDMALLNLPARPWVLPWEGKIAPDVDVLVIGAGMLGLCATAALRLHGVESVLCLDRAPQGQEGPWITFARMNTLRTAKTATGPALGVPSLTFRAWFVAQHGTAAWEVLDKIPRAQWMEYLNWYRTVLNLPVRNACEVTGIVPRGDGLFDVAVAGEAHPIRARRVIFATGIDGFGTGYIPPVVDGVDRRFYTHSADRISFEAFAGKRVGVVGAGASAMDNAATALEAGAASLDLFVRRPALPAIDKFSGVSSEGLVMGYLGLPDPIKWRIMRYGLDYPVPAPSDSTRRVFRHANARMHVASPVLRVTENGDGIVVQTPHGETALDFLVFATGFTCAPENRPELATIEPALRRWSDRFQPDAGEESMALGASPDLAPDFAFQAREPRDQGWVSHLYCFSFDATLTHGKLTSGVPALTEAANRLVRGVASSLLAEDAERYLNVFRAYDRAELRGDEWCPEQIVAGAVVSSTATGVPLQKGTAA